MNILHLFWIIPITIFATMLVFALASAASREDFRREFLDNNFKKIDEDLYANLACALLHDIAACNNCKKCGDSGINARMNLVKRLAEFMGKDTP